MASFVCIRYPKCFAPAHASFRFPACLFSAAHYGLAKCVLPTVSSWQNLSVSAARQERHRAHHQPDETKMPYRASQVLRSQWQELSTHRKRLRFSDVPRILRQLPDCPKPALYLGVGGLVPFVAPSLYMLMSHSYIPMIGWWQTAYAASLLAFLGGIRWGHAIPNASISDSSQRSTVLREQLEDEKSGTTPPASEPLELVRVIRHQQHTQHPQLLYSYPNWHTLGYSIMPFTVGCVCLLLPTPVSQACILTALAAHGFYDITLPGYPDWFKALRLLLTLVSCTCLTLTLFSMVAYARDVAKAEGG